MRDLETQERSPTTKIKFTSEGGLAVLLTNKTGGASVKGRLVEDSATTDMAVDYTDAGSVDPIGVFYESGIADGDEAWIVVAGIAYVALGDNEATTRGNWVETHNAEAGYADATAASPAASPGHFEEIGHALESVAAGGGGTHVLARCTIHFL
jgi:hypothetical protein